jgi:hypothetical protein
MLQEAALNLSAFHSAEKSEKRQSIAKVTALVANQ